MRSGRQLAIAEGLTACSARGTAAPRLEVALAFGSKPRLLMEVGVRWRSPRVSRLACSASRSSRCALEVALGLRQIAEVVDGGQRVRVAVAEVSRRACITRGAAPLRLEVPWSTAAAEVVDGEQRCGGGRRGLTARLQRRGQRRRALGSPWPAAASRGC